MNPLVTADNIHNAPRLAAVLPEPGMPLQALHGVEFLIETLRSAEAGAITLCALGPLTNIAMALVKAPEVAGGIRELAVVGGARFELGDVAPAGAINTSLSPLSPGGVLP